MAKRDSTQSFPRPSDREDYRDFFPPKIKLEEYPDTDFLIESFSLRTDAERPYITFTAQNTQTGEMVLFTCGGERVVKYFMAHGEPHELPILARFYKAGSAWIME